MITTLTQAKHFMITKIPEYIGEELHPGEAELLETLLETEFFSRIEGLVDEADIATRNLASDDEFEHYLFNHIPNYTTILEESLATVISDYLEPDDSTQQ